MWTMFDKLKWLVHAVNFPNIIFYDYNSILIEYWPMSNTAKIKGLVGMQKQNRGWNNATVLITLKSSINKKSIIGNNRIKHNVQINS